MGVNKTSLWFNDLEFILESENVSMNIFLYSSCGGGGQGIR